MEGLIQTFHTSFRLRHAAGFQKDAELFAGIGELSIGILIERWGVFLFIGKNSTTVCKEFIRYAIVLEDLVEYMIIAVESLLSIKPGTGDGAGGVINGEMQVPDLSGDPFIGSSIHLLHFAEISASGTSGVSILNGD